MKTFSEVLLALLKHRKISQRKLASLLGVSEVSVSRYIKGTRTPRIEKFIEISQALGVAPANFIEAMVNGCDVALSASVYRNGDKQTVTSNISFVCNANDIQRCHLENMAAGIVLNTIKSEADDMKEKFGDVILPVDICTMAIQFNENVHEIVRREMNNVLADTLGVKD